MEETPEPLTVQECNAFLSRIHATSSTGGLEIICRGHALLGAVRFLQGWYLLVLTARRLQASIQGHDVYSVEGKFFEPAGLRTPTSGTRRPNTAGTQLVPLTCPGQDDAARATAADEHRYTRLLMHGLDLTRDFYYSPDGYCLGRSIQQNSERPARADAFESRFVWNSFLSRPLRQGGVRHYWLAALVHGSVDQRTLSLSGRLVTLTLLARRSRSVVRRSCGYFHLPPTGCLARLHRVQVICRHTIPQAGLRRGGQRGQLRRDRAAGRGRRRPLGQLGRSGQGQHPPGLAPTGPRGIAQPQARDRPALQRSLVRADQAALS